MDKDVSVVVKRKRPTPRFQHQSNIVGVKSITIPIVVVRLLKEKLLATKCISWAQYEDVSTINDLLSVDFDFFNDFFSI